MAKEEKERLDYLMGTALLDEKIRTRLVHERDIALLTAFGLSKETQSWLRALKAGTLTELAQAIMAHLQGEILVIEWQPAAV